MTQTLSRLSASSRVWTTTDVSCKGWSLCCAWPIVSQVKVNDMLFFCALTGCDIVSAFSNEGRKTAWCMWDLRAETLSVLPKLGIYPPTEEDWDLKTSGDICHPNVWQIQHSGWGSGCAQSRQQRPDEAIPPTTAALLQHTAAYLVVTWLPRQPSVSQRQRTLRD